MNIFVSDEDPFVSARNLDDQRVIKMCLETCQLLSTVAHLRDKKFFEELYKPTHIHHPCVAWAREDKHNLWWLIAHGSALFFEYSERFIRTHASEKVFKAALEIFGYDTPCVIKFQNCARNKELGIDFTYVEHVPHAYRFYLTERWSRAVAANKLDGRKRVPKWTGREPPTWYHR